MGEDQPVKTLCNNDNKSNWAEVIESHCTSMFRYRYNGGCFEVIGNNGLGQRQVENVGEDQHIWVFGYQEEGEVIR